MFKSGDDASSIHNTSKNISNLAVDIVKSIGGVISNAGSFITGVGVKVTSFVQSHLPVHNPLTTLSDKVLEGILNNNLTEPALNAIGIEKISPDSATGCTIIDFTTNSILCDMLHGIFGSNLQGITIPSPSGSLIFMDTAQCGSDYFDILDHELIRVIQEQTLGDLFLPLYALGVLIYNYGNDPLERQAEDMKGLIH